ncbi:MAG: hypothetical protein ACK501_03425 [Planctomycetota bacterium]
MPERVQTGPSRELFCTFLAPGVFVVLNRPAASMRVALSGAGA